MMTILNLYDLFYEMNQMTALRAYHIAFKEKKRINEYEPIILTNAEYSCLYARDIIKGRWTEAEPIVLTDPEYSYWYALNVIKDRWPEAEPMILTSSHSSFCYALDVLENRWLDAESIIKQIDYNWELYCQHFNIKKDKANWIIGL